MPDNPFFPNTPTHSPGLSSNSRWVEVLCMSGFYFHISHPLKITSLFSLANLTKSNVLIKAFTVCFSSRQTSLQSALHSLLFPESGKTDKVVSVSQTSAQNFQWLHTRHTNEPPILEPGLWGCPPPAPHTLVAPTPGQAHPVSSNEQPTGYSCPSRVQALTAKKSASWRIAFPHLSCTEHLGAANLVGSG